MAGESQITVVGNLTADPELRFTPSGSAVANLNIAVNSKKLDRQRNEWVEQPTTFWRASIWRDYAEHVASTLTKGMQVIAQGTVATRTFQTKEGENRSVMELELSDIGPALRFQEASVRKAGNGGGSRPAQSSGGDWGAPAGPATGGWGGVPNGSDVPF